MDRFIGILCAVLLLPLNLAIAEDGTSNADVSSNERKAQLARHLPSGAFEPVRRSPPMYPTGAANKGKDGWVHLEFTIQEPGVVEDVKVVASYPSGLFDESAKRAVKKWKYKRSDTYEDALFPVLEEVVITFELDGNAGVSRKNGWNLRKAREAIFDQDFASAEELISRVQAYADQEELNLYEFAALRQTHGLLAFARGDYDSAASFSRWVISSRSTFDDDNLNLTHRLLVSSYIATQEFRSAVRAFDDWQAAYPDEDKAPLLDIVDRIRTALNEGRTVVLQ